MPIRIMTLILGWILVSSSVAWAVDVLPPVSERYVTKAEGAKSAEDKSAAAAQAEEPSFQRHVSPLFGRL